MIDESQARLIAEQSIAERQGDDRWQLGDHVTELPEHWVFSYNTADYFASGGPFGLAGNGPIAVSKADGHVRWLRGGKPLEEQLR